jgi:hypothetical protein
VPNVVAVPKLTLALSRTTRLPPVLRSNWACVVVTVALVSTTSEPDPLT